MSALRVAGATLILLVAAVAVGGVGALHGAPGPLLHITHGPATAPAITSLPGAGQPPRLRAPLGAPRAPPTGAHPPTPTPGAGPRRPTGAAAAVLGGAVALAAAALAAFRPSPSPSLRRPLTCIAFAGGVGGPPEPPAVHPTGSGAFDPLGLRSPAPSPRGGGGRPALLHGRLGLLFLAGLSSQSPLVAGAALAQGTAVATGEAELRGLGSTFEVEFAGMRVDHKLLLGLVVLGQFVGFIGALVGGAASRERSMEAEVLAKKLRFVNQQLRQNRRRALQKVRQDVGLSTAAGNVIRALKEGKAMLKDKEKCKEALNVFQEALKATQDTAGGLGDRRLDLQRKAFRGVGAALAQLGRYEGAVKAMECVLRLTEQIGDKAGVTDAYGAMADILAEGGQLGKAAAYYDLYLKSLDAEMMEDTLEASRYRL